VDPIVSTGSKTILVIGTYDTKSDELEYLAARIRLQGGKVVTMDVSVLGEPPFSTDLTKHDVAKAAGSSIQAAIESGEESAAMQIMAKGAATLVRKLHAQKRIDGLIAMGGTMGTDLALDCARALPMGVPKYIISTVAFSPLIPAERLAADVQMILWAGGLYGLNPICKASLSQAAGAVLGAARAVELTHERKPLVGITSLGKSALKYMVPLKPELEKRGFEVAIFHATGIGGRAFESLAAEGAFACVMDFCMQEFTNGILGSIVNSGADRLTNAGRAGIPQLVAPGASDLVDVPAWAGMPEKWKGRPYHEHNRLIGSFAISPDERRTIAREMMNCLELAKAPVTFLMPLKGIEEWDKEGGPAHDPEGLAAFVDEIRKQPLTHVAIVELDCHINDLAFAAKALEIFDCWLADGTVQRA
jgi:uncharacterized protein (UPF0261 family)